MALLGAESTGKSSLAQALVPRLEAQGLHATVVPEWLRLWCERHGRTPRADEQAALARQHWRQILEAGIRDQAPDQAPSVLLCDTTPLQVAVYSDWIFGDPSLVPAQTLRHRRWIDLTLLLGLDLPWAPDPWRDGPQAQAPVQQGLRNGLWQGNIGHHLVYGCGDARTEWAYQLVLSATKNTAFIARQSDDKGQNNVKNESPVGRWQCTCCGDPTAERRLFVIASHADPAGSATNH